jgi:hypothetical protein
VKLAIEDFHAGSLSNCEFRGNRCSERHTSRKGINDILPSFLSLVDKIIFCHYIPHLLSDLGEICKRDLHVMLASI